MEVLFGPPSFAIQVASSSSFHRDRTAASPPPPPPDHALDSPWNRFDSDFRSFTSAKPPEDEIDYRSDSSSSIGVPDDDESDGESVSSTGGDLGEMIRSKSIAGFASLGSLEESLPIKRGLSSHFSGKSKSFMNLAEANSVKDIEKPENSFNKRRRVLIASKLAKKSPFYTWPNPKSMPLLALREEDDGGDDDEEDEQQSHAPYSSDEDEESKGKRISDFHHRRLMSFKSRSFSLADLQHQHHDRPQEH